MGKINLTFSWGRNFHIFNVLSNFCCLFSGFLGPLTPFSFIYFIYFQGFWGSHLFWNVSRQRYPMKIGTYITYCDATGLLSFFLLAGFRRSTGLLRPSRVYTCFHLTDPFNNYTSYVKTISLKATLRIISFLQHQILYFSSSCNSSCYFSVYGSNTCLL